MEDLIFVPEINDYLTPEEFDEYLAYCDMRYDWLCDELALENLEF